LSLRSRDLDSIGERATLAVQIDKIMACFALKHVVLVCDRGMITQTRIDEDIAPAGLDWIALRAPAIRALVEAGELQLSLFDRRDIAAITSPDYPDERLIVCRNGGVECMAARRDRAPLPGTKRTVVCFGRSVALKFGDEKFQFVFRQVTQIALAEIRHIRREDLPEGSSFPFATWPCVDDHYGRVEAMDSYLDTPPD
jgi:hypothetical protein